MGTLYYGDNLEILQRYLKDETVDLVYLDPPFNSAQNYNAFFHEKDGTDAASQIQAFEDTWHWDIETKRAYDGLIQEGPLCLCGTGASLKFSRNGSEIKSRPNG